MQARDRLIVALDASTREEILRFVDVIAGEVGLVKIGLQAFIANGPAIVREVTDRGVPIFLDLKIHDIPNTALHAVREVAALGVAMTTVHAAGGGEMLRSCACDPLLVLGVTMLTSIGPEQIEEIGMHGSAEENVVRLAKLVKASGLGGVVASPHEVSAVRDACGENFRIVTPGVRPKGADAGDQKRLMTPAAAIRAGADYLVVGRPITQAADPRSAALRIVDEMDEG